MTKRTSPLLVGATALTLCLPIAANAQSVDQPRALIVSSFALSADPVARQVRSDALEVSEALFGLGYSVRRLENPIADVLDAAIADQPTVVFYTATEAVHADSLLATLDQADDTARFVFLDLCQAELVLDGDLESAFTLPEQLPSNSFVAASVAPDVPCGVSPAPVAARLLDSLRLPGVDVAAAFSASERQTESEDVVWHVSSLVEPHVFRQPASDTRLTAADYAFLETLSPEAQNQMISMWREAGIAVDRDGGTGTAAARVVVQDTIVISEPVRPVRTASPVVASVGSSATAPVQDAIRVITPDATSVANRAVPGVGGLPEPSVIVGLLEGATPVAFGTTVTEDGGALTGSELDYANLDGRRSMKAENPELYASLVESGAFDPPPSLLVVALQEELTRMDCYNRGIDGAWGGGSEAGLRRFYEQIDVSPENLQPTLASFRQIMLQDDVECPPVVVAQPARPAANSGGGGTTRRTTTTTSRPAAAAPAPAPAPSQPASTGRTINRSSGTGIFR